MFIIGRSLALLSVSRATCKSSNENLEYLWHSPHWVELLTANSESGIKSGNMQKKKNMRESVWLTCGIVLILHETLEMGSKRTHWDSYDVEKYVAHCLWVFYSLSVVFGRLVLVLLPHFNDQIIWFSFSMWHTQHVWVLRLTCDDDLLLWIVKLLPASYQSRLFRNRNRNRRARKVAISLEKQSLKRQQKRNKFAEKFLLSFFVCAQ